MKVTGILPTRGRGEFAAKALACFLAQDYPDKELIILDDLADPSFQTMDPPAGVLYARHGAEYKTIGEKRNACCALATGDIIAHFDSDDYSAPDRLSIQVKMLQDSGRAVTGFHSLLFVDEARKVAGVYGGRKDYAVGTSLCYRRDWWRANPFPTLRMIGEDNRFVSQARGAKQLIACAGGNLMVARVHAGNTSKKNIGNYKKIDWSLVPKGFFN